MGYLNLRRQRGVALPIMLIMLVVMMVSSVYLLKSSNSSTISASNMAYDDSLSKAADLGLHAGFQYLQAQSKASKANMLNDDLANGYHASYDGTMPVTSSDFWPSTSPKILPTATMPYTIQYVIYRACQYAGSYDAVGNSCMETSANVLKTGSPVALGTSLGINSSSYNSAPQIHYIITARIFGPRGGYVVNQMVVLIDA